MRLDATKLAIAIVCALAGNAFAESKADALFNKGKQQLADKKYAEACGSFEKVDQLDPAVGAKLFVAKCYEEWGKLAKAYQWYADALKMAKDKSDKRADKIKALVDAIDSDVPRLTIKLPGNIDPATVTIRIDGQPFATTELGKEQRVDPGDHVIDYLANRVAKTKAIALERGGSTEIELAFNSIQAVAPKRAPPGSSVHNWRKLTGIGIGSAGVIGLGVSGILTLSARSSYKDALAADCRGATDMCDAVGIEATSDARHKANVATVISIVGAAALVGGVVLILTAPRAASRNEHTLHLAPSVGDRTAAVILGGTF